MYEIGNGTWTIKHDEKELIAGIASILLALRDEIICSADLSEFLVSMNKKQEEIKMIGVEDYGVWIKSYDKYFYNMYRFKSYYFFQGILTVCNAYGIDFRDYIYGYMFDKNGEQFVLNGYNMIPSTISTDIDETEINDEDIDNEKISVPLVKDY